MASMDIFSQNAFSMVSLTEAIQDIEIPPQTIGAMNLFAPRPVRTTTVAIERVAQELSLIHTSARGAPLDQQDAIKRTIRDFRTTRLAKGDTVYADEIQGIRASAPRPKCSRSCRSSPSARPACSMIWS